MGFGHISFTVPDVAEALERMKGFGYEVIKPLGEAEVEQMGLPPDVVKGRHEDVAEGYKHVFRQLAFVRDPDVSYERVKRQGKLMLMTYRGIGLNLCRKW